MIFSTEVDLEHKHHIWYVVFKTTFRLINMVTSQNVQMVYMYLKCKMYMYRTSN
jgi:hypothetical protein